MSEAHEVHVHLLVCIDRLSSAWRIFRTVEANLASPLAGPAFRYAIVEYATAFTRSDGSVRKRRQLAESVVPDKHVALHRRIVKARHSTHAHADLTVLDAALSIAHVNGKKYVTRIQNSVTGLEELPHLGAVIALVEAVLDHLYIQHNASERDIAA